jgi:putative Mn2+ efflux pump MntP
MSFAELLLLAIGLAMDATAVAASRGLAAPAIRARELARIALVFGGAQTLMPLLGALTSAQLGDRLAAFDHWIAWAILTAIGLKMLVEARAPRGPSAPPGDARAFLRWPVLIALALATSIDALAVGLSLPLLGARLLPAVLTIGLTTALLSALGFAAGRRCGALLGRRLDVFGGLVLIGFGCKILVEHLRQP